MNSVVLPLAMHSVCNLEGRNRRSRKYLPEYALCCMSESLEDFIGLSNSQIKLLHGLISL